MTDENKLLRQSKRGAEAKQILEHELFIEATEKLESDLTQIFKESSLSDDATRRMARESLGLLVNLKTYLMQVMTTGDAARKQLIDLREPSRLRRMMHV